MAKLAFKAGDRVAWHHSYATQFAASTVVRASAVPQGDPAAPGAGQFGSIVEASDKGGFLWLVQLDGESEPRELTTDELVRVEEQS